MLEEKTQNLMVNVQAVLPMIVANGDCQEFRARLSMMGAKEPVHAETQRASHF
jgi:hypothetical protein